MKKFSISLIAGFIVNNVLGTLAALLVAKPLVGHLITEFERKPDEVAMPFLLAGYFLLTLMMVTVYPYLNLSGKWFKKGSNLGTHSWLNELCLHLCHRRGVVNSVCPCLDYFRHR